MKQSTLILLAFLFLACNSNDTDGPDADSSLKKIEYVESDSIIFNPERGFFTFNEFRSDNSNTLTLNSANHLVSNGLSIVYTTYTMPDYRDKPIPQEFLDRMVDNMEVLRQSGLKCVLRFRYTSSTNDTPWDAPEDVVHGHIEQIAPILKEYSDVTLILEAGFIGVWGEWYYTEHFIYRPSPEEFGPRRRLLDALLKALPTTRMVAVRYPAAKLYSFDLHHSDTLTIQTAHNGSDLARVAFHNDCFLADQDDRGTFGGNRNFRNYWAAESKYVGMGGETCGVSSYSECMNTIKDMERYHWTFLNSSYHPSVIGQWNSEGCIDEIKKRLGYRFVLESGEFSPEAEKGNSFQMKLKIKNVGFAAPFNPRGVEVLFVSKADPSEKYRIKLNEDPRFWFAGETTEVSATFGLPADMPTGEYDVVLNLPDPEPTLKDRKVFNIRLANENVWDYEKGYNKLHSVSVAQAQSSTGFSGTFLEKVQ